MDSLLTRFLRYISYDTRADDTATTVPSSAGQQRLAEQLGNELKTLGLCEVTVTSNAYVTALLPGNTPYPTPCIGLLAHLDTATEALGGPVNPQIVTAYDGVSTIPLGNALCLAPAMFPELRDQKDKTLVVTDGTTLLGADDKAGIAIIMTVLQTLTSEPKPCHGPVRIAFVPDEEIGHGAALLDLKTFAADFAYTVDGSTFGSIEYENFNAARADIAIRGVSIHPGHAKDHMINAILVGHELLSMLPPDEVPARTSGRQGFFHVVDFHASVGEANLQLIIRDHDRNRFEKRKTQVIQCVEKLNQRYPDTTPRLTLSLHDQYANMSERIAPHMHIVDNAIKAMKDCGITPSVHPIRGGTDGSQLSWRGLPTPNLFCGDHNAHGPFEFVAVEDMEASVKVIVRMLGTYAQGK